MEGRDIAAVVVAAAMIFGPMAAGAKKGIDEGVTRDTPVMAPASAPAAPAMTNAPK